MLNQHLQKVRREVADRGLLQTAGVVLDHAVKQCSSRLEGTPGYYSLRMHHLCRRYDEEVLVPIWVSPDEINHLTGEYERRDDGHLDYIPYFKPREADWGDVPCKQTVPYGTVLDGDWDSERPAFSKLLMYRGVQDRFQHGKQWEDTAYYSGLLERFQSHGWDSDDAVALTRKRCGRIESLYTMIEAEGYRTQQQINGHPLHEVTVTVARDGTLLYNCEGRHRLSIAKVLGIEKIPVLVLVRHAEFDGTVGTTEPQEHKQ